MQPFFSRLYAIVIAAIALVLSLPVARLRRNRPGLAEVRELADLLRPSWGPMSLDLARAGALVADGTIEELRETETNLVSEIREIDQRHAGKYLDPDSDDGKRWNAANEELNETRATIAQLEARADRIAEIGDDPERTEPGEDRSADRRRRDGGARKRARDREGEALFDLTSIRSAFSDPAQAANELRERALVFSERARPAHEEGLRERSQQRIERLLLADRDDSPFARYVLAAGDPTYKRAFGKYLAGLDRDRDESAAMQRVQMAQRALSLTAAAGGYAVPYELDPTIMLTSNGVVNPLREISRIETITVDEWRGVTSAGITASYEAEATEVGDDSPTLAQPVISTEKAQAFVPFSIEVGQDWPSLQSQMALLLQDAKDTLEANKFAVGSGADEPFGVLTGTTNTVNAAAGQTFTLANLYSLAAALPARYRPMGKYLGDLGILNRIRQFDTVGSSAIVWADGLSADTPAQLLGKPAYEASEMPDTPATGNKFLLFGDFKRGFVIVDRVGLNVEIVQHLMGANQRPTGERGIYAYWRNSSKVVDANAFRALIGVA